MTATLTRPRAAVERYRRADGSAVELTYRLRGWRHVVRLGEAEPEAFDDVEAARARWSELRAELRARGFRRAG